MSNSMESQVSLMIAGIMLLVLISFHHQTTCVAAPASDLQTEPYRVKRSFCNTYGGCSSTKRSIQQQQQASIPYASGTLGTFGAAESRTGEFSTTDQVAKKDARANLVAEILGDLIEYLQTDEKYRQGKYVVMVPKQQYDDSASSSSRNLMSTIQRETNNNNNSPGEMQELQVGRLYVKRDE